jgi:A/G-specific adenine glycosylase
LTVRDPDILARLPSPQKAAAKARQLLRWYDIHARDLPWRVPPGDKSKPDPYAVWLSEIMLQQTVVATVIPYFEAFTRRWPTVEALAHAPSEEVMAAWAGLGYYTRARNLVKCARVVTEELGGNFPPTEEGLIRLPGIGPYTAAAVAAIAFGAPATVVDGNVDRVMVRLFGIRWPIKDAKSEIWAFAKALTPKQRAGDYAQAVMDLGATVCSPKSPSCEICPWAEDCVARELGIAGDLPLKLPRRAKPTRRGAAFWITRSDGAVLLRRRPEKGLLGGMVEVPGSEWRTDDFESKTHLKEAPVKAKFKPVPGLVTHTFTHFHLELLVFSAQIDGRKANGNGHLWTRPEDLADVGLPTVMKKVVRLVGEPV